MPPRLPCALAVREAMNGSAERAAPAARPDRSRSRRVIPMAFSFSPVEPDPRRPSDATPPPMPPAAFMGVEVATFEHRLSRRNLVFRARQRYRRRGGGHSGEWRPLPPGVSFLEPDAR